MGSQSRPARRRLRDRLVSAAVGGLIVSVSVAGVAPTTQAATAAPLSAQATQLTAAADQVEEQAEETALLRHRHHRRHHHRRHHHRHHHRRHHHRRHHHRHHHRHRVRHHHHTSHATLVRRRALSKGIARRMVRSHVQFACFSHVISHESDWNPRAENSIGAYGLPQALPARKLATAGSDWRTNPRTQLRWAVHYMHERYGSPCKAWSFWQRHHWY